MDSVEAGFPNSEDLFTYGPTLYVQIGFDLQYRIGASSPPALSGVTWPALIDTGALLSCIDSALAEQLRLPVANEDVVTGVHGPQETAFYAAQVYAPELDLTAYGLFAGLPLVQSGFLHSALIGRSFLRDCQMHYDGPSGSVTVSRP